MARIPRRTLFALLILSAAGAAVLFASGIAALTAEVSADVIGSDVTLVAYTRDGTLTGHGLIEIPLEEDVDGLVTFTVYLDLNGDGRYLSSERAVDHVPTVAHTALPSAFPTMVKPKKLIKHLTTTPLTRAKIILENFPDGRPPLTVEVPVARETFEISDFFGSPPPGFTGGSIGGEAASDAADKDSGVPSATGDVGAAADVAIYNKGVPDLPGRKGKPNECFPMAATNSLIWLAGKDGFQNQIPQNPDDIANELDEDVGYDPNSGTEDGNMVSGKNKFAARHGIPLETKKIDNVHAEGESDLWGKIVKELEEGEDVELIIKKKTSPRGKEEGGHAVTVVGAHSKGKKKYIVVHDVLTRVGDDTYEVARNGQVEGYGGLGGKVFVSFIISESTKPPPAE